MQNKPTIEEKLERLATIAVQAEMTGHFKAAQRLIVASGHFGPLKPPSVSWRPPQAQRLAD